jgi:cell division septation protein DedD
MIASISLLIATLALQGGADTTRTARVAYTTCLRQFVDRSMQERMTQEAFDAAFPQQCQPQLGAFRTAIIARENALRATRANAEETANLEIEDSQVNQRDMFIPPASAPAAQQAAAAPAPTTPPATPASQPQ